MVFPVSQVVSNAGQVNSAGDARANFLKTFAGEVLTAHRAATLFMGLTRVKSIASGKSASFPLFGRGSSGYHTPGELIQTNAIPTVERLVNIDDVAFSSVFLADIDQAIAHFESRKEYSFECGTQLAEMKDRNICRMLLKAGLVEDAGDMTAAGLTAITGQEYNAPFSLAAGGDELDGAALVDAIFKIRTQFRKLNIREELVIVLPPEQAEALINVNDVRLAPWLNKDVGGTGSTAEGAITRIAGINIYESNQISQVDESAGLSFGGDSEPLAASVGSGNTTKYRGDYSDVVGMAFTRSAVATTQLMSPRTQLIPEPLRVGETVLATQAVGHSILRPECAVALLKYSA